MGNKPSMPHITTHTATIMSQYNVTARDVAELNRKFEEYDVDKRGYWTINEAHQYLGTHPEELIAHCLNILIQLGSSTRDGRLSLQDFLVCFCSYCALSNEELLQFLYISIDKDRSGILDRDELFGFYSATVPVQRMYHNNLIEFRLHLYEENYLIALDQFKQGKWEGLIFEEFCLMCDLFHHLSFPAYLLQDTLRRRMLGLRFWKSWDNERLKIFHLETESKSIQFTAISLLTGEQVTITKPGRVTMKEIFEFTKRNGLRRIKHDEDDAVTNDENEDEIFGFGGSFRGSASRIKSGSRVKSSGSSIASDDASTPKRTVSTYTQSRDQVLAYAPLLNLIRNPGNVYYVNLEEMARMSLEALRRTKSAFTAETTNQSKSLDDFNNIPLSLRSSSDGRPSVHAAMAAAMLGEKLNN
jgi:hypothetical protein